MTRERPILFSGPMVRAILAGEKTQTRRVVTGEALDLIGPGYLEVQIPSLCPYGEPGDRLWVRETHALIWPTAFGPPEDERECSVEYRADGDPARAPGGWPDEQRGDPDAPRWRPSIHMPRWASRLTLDVLGVRVERLHEISEADARAEGVESVHVLSERGGSTTAREEFAALWDSINAKRGYPWSANPWVWVVSFAVTGGNGR